MLELTLAELARFDGRAGAPAYFAFRGTVYDATHSFHWQAGRHQVVHHAGRDLTSDLSLAPHGADLLARLPAVGILVEKPEAASRTAP